MKSEKLSPASSHGSPSGQKKSSAQKPRREGGSTQNGSLKRQAPGSEEANIKPKKKKSNEHIERASTPVNNGLKEISILSPATDAAVAAAADPSKAKSSSTSVRKQKDERARRRSLDTNDSPKPNAKETKHKSSKDVKIKKDKSLDLSSSGGLNYLFNTFT